MLVLIYVIYTTSNLYYESKDRNSTVSVVIPVTGSTPVDSESRQMKTPSPYKSRFRHLERYHSLSTSLFIGHIPDYLGTELFLTYNYGSDFTR